MSTGKKYREAAQKIETGREYGIDEALALLKGLPQPKFDGTVELHMRLGIDPKKAEQIVRSTVVLPHASGKARRIAAFVSPDKEAEAKAAGASLVGGAELVKEIQTTNKIAFDVAVTTPDFMKTLAPLARVLGPKGLMPNPKSETITTNLAKTIKELSAGKQTFRSDAGGNVHGVIGKVSQDSGQLKENFEVFVAAVKRAKPDDVKGTYLKTVTLASTMGPGIRVKA